MLGQTFKSSDLIAPVALHLKWYALHTRSRHEKIVARLLSDKGFETFLPLRVVCSRVSLRRFRQASVPLFPGYTFARFAAAEHQHCVRDTSGVARIVGDGAGPVSVPEVEIESLKTVLAAGVACAPSSVFTVGRRVVVTSGPLKGVVGEIVRHKKREVFTVKVQLLKRMVELDFSALDMELAPAGEG